MYRRPDVTCGYVNQPYHALRRQIAVEALIEGLEAGTPVGGPLLEIGPGAQAMLDELDSLRRRTVAVDLSLDALRALKSDHHALLCVDASRPLPFADGSFAAVLMGEVIEHVYYPERLLRELARVLGPGGVLVLTTPNLATLWDRVRFLLGREPRQVDPLHPYLFLHIRPMTRRLLGRLLEHAGFEVATVRSNYVGLRLPFGRWRDVRWLARLAPGLGGSLIVSARRRPDRR